MIVTIDPGLAGTGWALWTDGWKLQDHGVIIPGQIFKDSKEGYILARLKRVIKPLGLVKVFVEEPAYMGGGKGLVTARSGALVKLVLFVGMVMNEFSAEGVKVRDWKGQLPKNVVIKRIKKEMPECRATSHDWDAIGIGLYLAGRF